MAWVVVMRLLSSLLQTFCLGRTADQAKALEILLLRRQLAIPTRQNAALRCLSRAGKLTLVVLTTRLKTICDWSIVHLGAILILIISDWMDFSTVCASRLIQSKMPYTSSR